ncbi:uncharacterized protein LOC143741421 [Siphateles boraxobius]|uniref:uncharacterized protein LOC143741421 n=1 Tax=Siphateles boraxobius TaxID=180520 RepID=UPI004063D5B4
MSTTSVVGRGGVDNLEIITFVSDALSDSIASQTAERKADVITAWISPNIDTVENNPAEKPRKGRKSNPICAFFKRVCKAVKIPFLGCDSNRVLCLTPQLNPHLDDPELMHIQVSSRKTAVTLPEPPSLPGQVCADHEQLSVPGPSGIQQTPEGDSADPEPLSGPFVNKQIADVDPADPDPSCVPGPSWMKQTPDTDPAVPKPVFDPGSTHFKMNYEKPTKWRKKAIFAFFKRVCKTLKRPFCCCDPNRVVHLTPQSDPHLEDPEPSLYRP